MLPQHRLLGFSVNPGSCDDYLTLIRQSISGRAPVTVLYHNLHSLYSYFTDATLRQCYEDRTVLVDGMPVIWLMRVMGFDVNRSQRLTYVDFIRPMMQQARELDWMVWHLGQSSEIQNQALEILRREIPGLRIGGRDGYFDQAADSPESLEIVSEMNEAGAELVLVGFGAPRQELWLQAHRHRIEAPAVFACGACMEYVAGAVKTPPRWMGRMGLEWSFRLFENPRRFAFRYAVEPVLLCAILLFNALRERAGRAPVDTK